MRKVEQPTENDVLLAVDIQNDFLCGGALAVADGEAVVLIINRVDRAFSQVILTQDWRLSHQLLFASNHPGPCPFETVMVPCGEQIL